MIYYDYYADIPPETVDAFVREREMGRLVTVSTAGLPHLGLYPFAYQGNTIEVHLNRTDEQIADLAAAISWAARCPAATHGVVEVRPLWGTPA